MRKFIMTTAVCFWAMSQMMAQNISGKIVDAKGEPLAFANVVLLYRQDSAFVKGTVSGEDGRFTIDSPCNGGIIKVTSVGYKTIFKDCKGENVGVIKMEEDSKMLGEVVIKSSLPKTILKNGGMTTTVAGSVLEKAGTMEWQHQGVWTWRAYHLYQRTADEGQKRTRPFEFGQHKVGRGNIQPWCSLCCKH